MSTDCPSPGVVHLAFALDAVTQAFLFRASTPPVPSPLPFRFFCLVHAPGHVFRFRRRAAAQSARGSGVPPAVRSIPFRPRRRTSSGPARASVYSERGGGLEGVLVVGLCAISELCGAARLDDLELREAARRGDLETCGTSWLGVLRGRGVSRQVVKEDGGVLCAAPRLGVTERDTGRAGPINTSSWSSSCPCGPLLGAAPWVSSLGHSVDPPWGSQEEKKGDAACLVRIGHIYRGLDLNLSRALRVPFRVLVQMCAD